MNVIFHKYGTVFVKYNAWSDFEAQISRRKPNFKWRSTTLCHTIIWEAVVIVEKDHVSSFRRPPRDTDLELVLFCSRPNGLLGWSIYPGFNTTLVYILLKYDVWVPSSSGWNSRSSSVNNLPRSTVDRSWLASRFGTSSHPQKRFTGISLWLQPRSWRFAPSK